MGSRDDDLQSLDQPADAIQEVTKKAKITYTREFLLSLSELELCKQLPKGFDKSLLNEFHAAFRASQEKSKAPGCFASQNVRNTEYSASPPARRDTNSYSRGSAGKWESRSRESDSLSDRDSESGGHVGPHSRRLRQNSEHDGLLGSGSSPKLTGYTTGASAPKFGVNDQYHLSRSSAPYQPPRPCKAVPHTRSCTSDLHNDETFGSAEMTSEDQAEEERKRRAEFELMRKERYKSSQDKQKQHLSPVDCKDDLIAVAAEYSGNLYGEKRIMGDGINSTEPSTILAPPNTSTKSSTTLQIPAPRPVVPPGFANTSVVGKCAIKHNTKVQTSEMVDQRVYGTLESSVDKKIYNKIVKQPDDLSRLNTAAVSNQDFAALPLEDIFGNSLTMNTGDIPILTERRDGSLHDKWKGSAMESSKFAHWFVEDDGKKLEDGHLSEKPVDLFAIMGGGPTSELKHVDAKAAKSNDTSVPVLTCEDLEQSILSEMGHHKLPSEPPLQGSESRDVNVAEPKGGIDVLASQQLLSVLYKVPGPENMVSYHDMGKGSSDGHHLLTGLDNITDGSKLLKADKTCDVGKNPTLEDIFGSAFMKELQAVDAPVSTKRNSFARESSKFHHPENEMLNTVSDHLNPSNSFYQNVDTTKNGGFAPSQLPLDNPERLGALSAMFRDGSSARQSQDNQMFSHNPHGAMGHSSIHHNVHTHSSLPHFPFHDVSQGRNMYNQPDIQHIIPHMRFQDNMIRRDLPAAAAHQFLPGRQMFNQPRAMGSEPPSQQSMMQQMQVQGSPLPSHLARQYSSNLPQPLHPYNQVLGFRRELDPMQGFHMGHQQPSFGGLGMSPPVSDNNSGSHHHPEALQRLIEMELRSKPKPNLPFPGNLGGLPNF